MELAFFIIFFIEYLKGEGWMYGLKGQTAIVTGGSRGLGKQIVKSLLDEGVKVLFGSRTETEVNKLLGEYSDYEIWGRVLDVGDRYSVKSFVDYAISLWGKIDILVNCAGINFKTLAENYPEDEWLKVINVNLNGSYRACQEIGKHMIKEKSGKIVNITSIMSHIANPNQSAYAASKAGLAQYTKLLAVEWGKYNIRVNAISPGSVVTEMSKDSLLQPEFKEKVIEKTPLRRYGTPEEIADSVIFLVSDRSSFITGQVLAVDGGYLAGHPALYIDC